VPSARPSTRTPNWRSSGSSSSRWVWASRADDGSSVGDSALASSSGRATTTDTRYCSCAVIAGAGARGLELPAPSSLAAQVGRGIVATVEGHEVVIGTPTLLAERGIDASALASSLEAVEASGQTALLVAVDRQAVAVLAVADTVKADSAEAVASLERDGLAVWMITGDNRRTAESIAAQVGIAPEHVLAQVRPDEKAATVERLQRDGAVVAFVGDGVNDAPALAAAAVGIAMGTGAEVAMESADLTLVRGSLRGVVEALRLSRATMRTIKQNLIWAFGYNAILIPLAIASPAIPLLRMNAPIHAAAAMALSSITVVSNSLRLRRYGRGKAEAEA